MRSAEERFDEWASAYEDSALQRLIFRPSHDLILRSLDLEPVARIVDVGCGTGLLARRLASAYPDGQVVGIDVSSQMIEEAKTRSSGLTNLEFKVANAQDLEFPDSYFDCVTCCHSFHMHPDQRASLKEMSRVLRWNGTLAVVDTGKVGIVSRVFSHLHERFTLGEGTVKTFSPDDLALLFSEVGLVDVSVTNSLLRHGLPSMLVSGRKVEPCIN